MLADRISTDYPDEDFPCNDGASICTGHRQPVSGFAGSIGADILKNTPDSGRRKDGGFVLRTHGTGGVRRRCGEDR